MKGAAPFGRGRSVWKCLWITGFVKAVEVGNQRFKYVAIIHPTTAITRLRESKRIPDNWWNAYVARKLETREATHEQREKKKEGIRKIIPLVTSPNSHAPKKAQTK
jgi:hypothetical protein